MSDVIVPNKELMAGQFARTEELNERIYSRNVPDTHLENWFSPTAQSTRFIKMPVLCGRGRASAVTVPQTIPVVHAPYNTERDFAGMTRTAPFQGFSSKIDTESSLRNQFYALQESHQAVYIPSSTSDLYNVSAVGRYEEQTHPGLFIVQDFKTSDHPNLSNSGIGVDRWFNHTRTQLRGIGEQ